MKWQTIVAGLVALPVLALFGGMGFLAYQVGQTWDARSTDSLIAGLVATCGGGVVVIGLLLALIIGIPFAIRMFGEAGYSQRAWREPPPPAYLPRVPFPERTQSAVDTTWQSLPAPVAVPPWGMTGGGNIGLLPTPNQDKRFGMAKVQALDLEEVKQAWEKP
jgi:hypothetical protein